MPLSRVSAALVSLIALVGLALQLRASTGLTGSTGAALWNMLLYFTILTNLVVVFLFGAIAVGHKPSAYVLGAAVLAIMLVGVVYALLLHGLVELGGGALLANFLLHRVTPVVAPLWWLGFAPKGEIVRADPVKWTLPPIVYLGYALVRGSLERHYPYPFLDLTKHGWAGVLTYAIVIAAGFLAAGYGLYALDRFFAPGAKE
jgi:hypothetical protein